jgi:hypothetical protein
MKKRLGLELVCVRVKRRKRLGLALVCVRIKRRKD